MTIKSRNCYPLRLHTKFHMLSIFFSVDSRVQDEVNNQTRYECNITVVGQISNATLQSRVEQVAGSLFQLLPGVVIENEYRVSCKFG